jgi:uncharacterized membrane protein
MRNPQKGEEAMMRNRSHPVLHLPRTQLEKLLEVLTALGFIALLAMTVWAYFALPAIIVTHYDISGRPNAYGDKGSLLIVPIIFSCLVVLMTLVMIFVSRYPHLYNFPWPITAENAPRQYALARLFLHWLTLEIVCLLCSLQWIFIQAAQGSPPNLLLFFIPAMMLTLLVTIMLYLRAAAR